MPTSRTAPKSLPGDGFMPRVGFALLALSAAGAWAAACVRPQPAAAQAQAERYETWAPLAPEFPSTTGGDIVIRGYAPVVSGTACRTDFQAVTKDGTVYRNEVEFDAVPTQGGVLCTNGRWRAKDGSASGTTPFRVFVKDGIARGSP